LEAIHLTPNSVLTDRGLVIDGAPQSLGHRDAFFTVARSTGAMVASVLAQVFPLHVAAPGPDGTAVPATLPAWDDYSQRLLMIPRLPADSTQRIVIGQILVQWCAAAKVAAILGDLDVVKSPEFQVVRYLADAGADALAHTAQSWDEHLDWEAWSRSPDALLAQLTGDGERPRPQRHTVRTVVPWPALLGADLGDESRQRELIAKHSTDIHCLANTTLCRMLGHVIRVELNTGLVEKFQDCCVSVADGAVAECAFTWGVEGKSYLVRAHCSPAKSGNHYAFRVLASHQEMSDLTSLHSLKSAS